MTGPVDKSGAAQGSAIPYMPGDSTKVKNSEVQSGSIFNKEDKIPDYKDVIATLKQTIKETEPGSKAYEQAQTELAIIEGLVGQLDTTTSKKGGFERKAELSKEARARQDELIETLKKKAEQKAVLEDILKTSEPGSVRYNEAMMMLQTMKENDPIPNKGPEYLD